MFSAPAQLKHTTEKAWNRGYVHGIHLKLAGYFQGKVWLAGKTGWLVKLEFVKQYSSTATECPAYRG